MTHIAGIGQLIRMERQARGWTQEQFAEIARVGVRTLQRVERDDRARIGTLRAIAAGLGVELEELRKKARASSKRGFDDVEAFPRLTSGKDLAAVVGGAEMFHQDYDDPLDASEVDLIAGFFQELQDLGDLWPDFESGQRVEMTHYLGTKLEEIESIGFRVFGKRARRQLPFQSSGKATWMDMTVASILVLRDDNPRIVNANSGESIPAVLPRQAP